MVNKLSRLVGLSKLGKSGGLAKGIMEKAQLSINVFLGMVGGWSIDTDIS